MGSEKFGNIQLHVGLGPISVFKTTIMFFIILYPSRLAKKKSVIVVEKVFSGRRGHPICPLLVHEINL